MRKNIFTLFLFLLLCCRTVFAAETIELKLTVSNFSTTEKKTLPVKTYLPKGIKPDDVVEKGDFSIAYDFEKSLYYAYQDIELEPNQSQELTVGFKDIWVLPLDDVKTLKNHVNRIMKALQKTEYAVESSKIGEEIISRLDKIINENTENLSMEDRVVVYEENIGVFKAQKKEIGVLEDMAIETGTLGEVNELMGESISTIDNLGEFKGAESLVIRMSVTNPFDEERVVPFKYFLPIEVKPEFIKNSSGLSASYDYRDGVYYLYNETVKFTPNETKDFAIEINDLWIISEEKIQTVKKRTERLMGLLAATEYQELSVEVGQRIISTLQGIISIQATKEDSIENHIGSFRNNLNKFSDALRDVAKLERLLIQSGGSIAKAMVDNKAPKAEGRGLKTEGSLTEVEKKGVEIFHKEDLKGKAPDVATTWRVIWYIIGFLGCLTLMFFILWWTEIKSGGNRTYRNVQGYHS